MRHRYFTNPEGRLAAEVERLVTERRRAGAEVMAFATSLGAVNVAGDRPENYSFKFSLAPHRSDWTKTKYGTYRPSRRSATGRALNGLISKLPVIPSPHDAVDLVPGLHSGFPLVIEDKTGYNAFIRFYDMKKKQVILSVPWIDRTPAEIEAYKADEDTMSTEMEFAQWTPPEWLTEIKEWEALKMIDESGVAAKDGA